MNHVHSEAYVDQATAVIERFDAMDRKDRYRVRKETYQPGTLFAMPLISRYERKYRSKHQSLEADPGSYAVGLLESCNWLHDINFYVFNDWFDHLPSRADAARVARPDNLLRVMATTDAYFFSEDPTYRWHTLPPPLTDAEQATIPPIAVAYKGQVQLMTLKPNRALPPHSYVPAETLPPTTADLNIRYDGSDGYGILVIEMNRAMFSGELPNGPTFGGPLLPDPLPPRRPPTPPSNTNP